MSNESGVRSQEEPLTENFLWDFCCSQPASRKKRSGLTQLK
ncbi:hypothetical protein [Mastigocoleus sp. MO_188.B34]|nr:hypothetical protein [Mastigocoleus sp. MO_188.B34]